MFGNIEMPNLMPGKPGTKEAFGISILNDDLTLKIPPKALAHYGIFETDHIILVTGHRGKSGFGLIKKATGLKSVFGKFIKQLEFKEKLYSFNNRTYVMLEIKNGIININDAILKTYYLKIGDRLLVVKSTTTTMSFTPVEIWIENFKKHRFNEAIQNLNKLEVF
ncbi:MAG: hypothetical protein EU549_02155 [Promethearchaeota archaeon]|nr:MAG: hypothetical protein EU549_02155 [Candidatus Lokiarchaeota archaeon]